MKDDERQFLRDAIAARATGECVRDFINSDRCVIHHKRAWYLLEKWVRKSWYDYGVSLDLGWFTEEGITASKPRKC